MKNIQRHVSLGVLALVVLTLLWLGNTRAQEPGQVAQPVTQTLELPALTFPEGKTISIKMKGTERLPKANGEAKVERKTGSTEIEIELDEMKPAASFGGDLNTYVLWSASPQGLATNLGEFVLDGNRSRLNVSSRLQAFGLLVTAEPHYLVQRPSRFVVLQMDRPSDSLKIPLQTAKVEYRGQEGVYRADRDSLTGAPEAKTEIRTELAQARTAVKLAAAAKAEQLEPKTFTQAQFALGKTEEAASGGVDQKRVLEMAHETVRLAYEAQLSAEKRAVELAQAEETARLERERQQAALGQAEEASQRAQAEAAAEAARRQTEAARRQTEEAQRQQEASRLAAVRAESEKAELRAKLLQQFNAILPTTDTDRGLVVNIGDVLFDTGKSDLQQDARLKLARFSGIILNYPALRVQSEGHTDSTGSAEFNQNLSEQRAAAVRGFLIEQGLPADKISSVGRGFAVPVVGNDTAEDRQKNRRVELIISGDVIGTAVGSKPVTRN